MTEHQCPQCEEPLTAITVVDQLGGGVMHTGLAFTFESEPRTSGWSGKLKNKAGAIRAEMCESCSRVFFFASRGL